MYRGLVARKATQGLLPSESPKPTNSREPQSLDGLFHRFLRVDSAQDWPTPALIARFHAKQIMFEWLLGPTPALTARFHATL